MSLFVKATRKKARLRLLVAGPSGSGKTTWALATATAVAGGKVTQSGPRYITDIPDGRVAVIDTEKGSASLYADQFNFDVMEFGAPYSPARLREAIESAAAAGYEAVIVDGLTPFWNGPGGVLEIVDAEAAKARNNTYAGWKAGTPAQNLLVQSLLDVPIHVIATVRSKQDYVLETDARGKQAPKKVGMAPVQRDGLEYEFTVAVEVDLDHAAVATKTRFPELADRLFRKSDTVAFGAEVAALVTVGVEPARPEQLVEIQQLADVMGLTAEKLAAGLQRYARVANLASLTPDLADRVLEALRPAAAKGAVAPAQGTAETGEVAA